MAHTTAAIKNTTTTETLSVAIALLKKRETIDKVKRKDLFLKGRNIEFPFHLDSSCGGWWRWRQEFIHTKSRVVYLIVALLDWVEARFQLSVWAYPQTVLTQPVHRWSPRGGGRRRRRRIVVVVGGKGFNRLPQPSSSLSWSSSEKVP